MDAATGWASSSARSPLRGARVIRARVAALGDASAPSVLLGVLVGLPAAETAV
jgi:hypothetical protein